MNRIVFAVAFAIGLLTVGWVGMGFVGSSGLALAMTVVIAGVYLLGAFEVRQFRAATAALAAALDDLAAPSSNGLAAWLERVPASLRNPVRLRIEGERAGLPGLALTPYLVGLLVMLGMLGTFLGMVVTFKGAVFALEGSTDLQAVRSALAAPIKGLGLSFGTSVAGVAASAMLGLLSALSRRERLDVARQLDTRIATVLRPFSLTHQRQETFKALQLQAHALPDVVERLQTMMDGLERRSQQLNDQLVGQQAQFHREVAVAYTDLAGAVGVSLKDSLAAGAKAAGDSIQPVVEAAMAEIAQESTRVHQRVFDATQTQLNGLATAFGHTARSVSDGWTAALVNQTRTGENQVARLDTALLGFAETFEQRASTLLASVQEFTATARLAQTAADQQRLQGWTQALEAMAATLQGEWRTLGAQALAQQRAVCDTLEQTAGAVIERTSHRAGETLTQVAALVGQSEALVRAHTEAETRWTHQQGERLDQLAGVWRAELTTLRTEEAARGQAAVERLGELQATLAGHLTRTTADVLARTGEQAGQTLDGVSRLLARSEALVLSHTEAETRWTQQQGERMDALAGLWRTELGALRNEEATRGQAAVERLAELQAALAGHLGTLGAALEAPMARLMETAAVAPQAAAEVIAQLREEMSRLTERDNLALEERAGLVENINTLLQTLNQASGEQRAAIDAMVASASAVLDQAGHQFAETLGAQAGQAAEVAAQVTGSAVELASLGESFGHGVQLFSVANEKLVESLQRVEGAVQQSAARSDEQLAYYVAQAREVIDLSIASQQKIVEDMRRLRSPQPVPVEGVAG